MYKILVGKFNIIKIRLFNIISLHEIKIITKITCQWNNLA